MELHSPLVSVICAVYNGEKTVATSIDSVIAQTYPHWELILVNDGSKDQTVDIINRYAAADPRIILVNNARNMGQTASLNEGVKAARGTYIARIDADDFFAPDKLQQQVSFMEAHPEMALCGTNAVCADSDTGKETVISFPETDQDIAAGMLTHSSIIHVSVLIRKTALDIAGEYNTGFHVAADYELWARFVKAGLPMYNLQEALVTFNFSSATFGRSNMERTRNEFLRVNIPYLFWAVQHTNHFTNLSVFSRLVVPVHILTGKQILAMYNRLLPALFSKGGIGMFFRAGLLFLAAYRNRSSEEKIQTETPAGAAPGYASLLLIIYPLYALLRKRVPQS
jgi:glycosyltransferase involved in cell wall biosynthesis